METWVFSKGQATISSTPMTLPAEYDFVWIDITQEELPQLTDLLKRIANITFHEQHFLDCTNPSHPAFFDSMQDYDLLIFRSLMTSNKKLEIKTAPAVFIILNNILITLSENNPVIKEIKDKTLDPKRAHPKQMSTLLYQILNGIVDHYLSLRDPLAEQYHHWQKKLLDEKGRFTGWHQLLDYKTNIQRLSILCEQQLDAVNQWRQAIDNEINENFNVRLNDLSDHIRRVLRFSYQLERQLESLMQLHYSLISTRTNEVMRILTVISGIFLPLTLLTGIFGMNFEKMPLLTQPHGFFMTLGIMLTIIISLLAIFRYRQWI